MPGSAATTSGECVGRVQSGDHQPLADARDLHFHVIRRIAFHDDAIAHASELPTSTAEAPANGPECRPGASS